MAGLGVAVGLASIGAGAGIGPGPFPVGPTPIRGSVAVAAGDLALTTMALTIAAGTALLVLGAAPMVHGRPRIRRAIGLVLVAQAVLLLRLGAAGPAPDLEEIARAALLVACAATGAALLARLRPTPRSTQPTRRPGRRTGAASRPTDAQPPDDPAGAGRGAPSGCGLVTIVAAPGWRASPSRSGSSAASSCSAIALAMPAEESLVLGGVGLVGTPLVREMAVAWSAGLAALGLLEVGVGGRPTVVGPGLVGLAVAVVALATRDPATSVAALAAGGVAGVLVPACPAGSTAPMLHRASRPPVAARWRSSAPGCSEVAAIAFGASAVGPLGVGGAIPIDPTVRLAAGLALLAMVGAVALRCGLIPLHVWAARFMEGVSPLAIPAAFAWGSAAFVLVAHRLEPGGAWPDGSRRHGEGPDHRPGAS